ncbi:MAG: NlpC/P60 family protein, partial [Candidatus Limnocylindrales bacterium]
MSPTRVRLRALASLGLSTILFGALVPATAAVELGAVGQVAPAAPAAMIATASAETATHTTNLSVSPVPAATLSGTPSVVLGTASIVLGAVRRRSDDAADTGTTPTSATFVAPATVAASSRIIALAETHLGARYEHGATGPRAFDCSGLVYRVFEDAGLGRLIDGLRSADALYVHFRARHMTSTVNPQ